MGCFPGQKLGGLRSLRVLRLLRTIRRCQGLRVIVGAFFSSFISMYNVAALLSFFIIVFAIAGLHLWPGVLHRRCYENGIMIPESFCSFYGSSRGGYQCPGSSICIENSTIQNPINGIVGFDNFGTSVLTVFIISAMEDYSPIMYRLTDASFISWWFYMTVILMNSFFAMTLVIGVMLDEISNAQIALRNDIQNNIAVFIKEEKPKNMHPEFDSILKKK